MLPQIYQWATYPISALLEKAFSRELEKLSGPPSGSSRGSRINLFRVELIAALERCLAYAFTGSSRVLMKSAMDQLWLSKGILATGFPSLNNKIVALGAENHPQVHVHLWPTTGSEDYPYPASCASRAVEFNFGKKIAYVSAIHALWIPKFSSSTLLIAA